MKLRKLLARLKVRSVQLNRAEGQEDNIDAQSSALASHSDLGGWGPDLAPTNWVPSQQDDRPRH